MFTNARTSLSALVEALRAHSDKTALAVDRIPSWRPDARLVHRGLHC